ncbi:hypothetical protein TNCV_3570051 [Trichonephila clavipes]|nr:hypothetical protein TNCV_3570051 [Trichonephila clavipes]
MFADGLRNTEPQSRDTDGICIPSSNSHTTPMRLLKASTDLTFISSSTRRVFRNSIDFEPVIRHGKRGTKISKD